jgi:hypothetical protein
MFGPAICSARVDVTSGGRRVLYFGAQMTLSQAISR